MPCFSTDFGRGMSVKSSVMPAVLDTVPQGLSGVRNAADFQRQDHVDNITKSGSTITSEWNRHEILLPLVI